MRRVGVNSLLSPANDGSRQNNNNGIQQYSNYTVTISLVV